MVNRHEIKIVVSEELRGMDLTQLVERAAEYEGGAEYAERQTHRVNITSCGGCSMDAAQAALRVWIAKREERNEERQGAK